MGGLTKIVLAGEGGQGIQTVAEILAQAADSEGRESLYIPSFGVEQRGGASIAYVQVGDVPPPSPRFAKADIMVILSDRAVLSTKRFMSPETVYVYDSSFVDPALIDFEKEVKRLVAIPATEIAKRDLSARVFNIIILGALVAATKVISKATAQAAIDKLFGKKFKTNPELRDLNYRALDVGTELIEKAEREIKV